MKRNLLGLIALLLVAPLAHADGNKEAAASIAGKWNNTATHLSYSINNKGIVGRTASTCEGELQQTFSLAKGEGWLLDAERLAKDKLIPKSQYAALAKEIDRTKDYPHLRSTCFETSDNLIMVNADMMLSISCGEGSCLLVRHVRAH